MPKIRCGFFLIIFIQVHFSLALAQQDRPLDLKPIVVSKSKPSLIKSYSFDSQTIKYLPFTSPLEGLSILPLDLQSRSPRQDIQTDFSLRGSTFQGVLMLLNGQRINDPQTAHHNSDIPLTREDIENIQVIPGLGSSLFGPDAIGGAINITTKKPRQKKRVLELSLGEHKKKSVLFSISDKIGQLGTRLSLENQESSGFYEDTDFKKFTSRLDSSWEFPDGEFDFGFGYQEKEFGAYDFYTPGLGYPSKEWTKTYLLNTGLNLDKEGLIIRPNFLWRRHFDKFMLDKTQVRLRYLNHHRTDVYTPNIYFQKAMPLLGRMGLGLEYGEEKINSTNLGKHNRQYKSIFMDEEKDLTEKLSFALSFRSDDYDSFDQESTGAVDLRYKFYKDSSIRLGISTSIRVPSFTELYYNDPFTQGNSGLSSEKSLNYEAGYDYKRKDFSFGTTLFLRQEENLIDWIKRTPSQSKWQVENINEDEIKGLESYLGFRLNDYLELNSNYTYIDKRIDDRGYLYKYGPNYIKHLGNILFKFNLPFGAQGISLTYKKKLARDGWFLLNTHFSYNLNKNSRLFLKITNLFNVEYQEIEGIPQPGRWIEAGLRFEW